MQQGKKWCTNDGFNLYLSVLPRGDNKEGMVIHIEIIVKNFPELLKNINSKIQSEQLLKYYLSKTRKQ